MLLVCISSMECKFPDCRDLALLTTTPPALRGLLDPSVHDMLDTSSNSSF